MLVEAEVNVAPQHLTTAYCTHHSPHPPPEPQERLQDYRLQGVLFRVQGCSTITRQPRLNSVGFVVFDSMSYLAHRLAI